MPTVTLKAHFDGTTIQLDEPYELLPGAHLLVIVLPHCEETDWVNLSARGLARAYDGYEPEYLAADVEQ